MNLSAMFREETLALVTRFQCHPPLQAQVAPLVDEVENRAGALNTGDEAEEAIVERMRQFGREALTQWAEQWHAAVQPARTPGLRQAGKKICWQTTLGPIGLTEQLWRRGSHTQRPFCAATQVQPRGCSRRLQRALIDFGADYPSPGAAAKVQEHYGVRVPAARVRTVTLHHAQVLAAQAPQPVR